MDDPRRFGQKLPNPKIKHSKNAGPGVLYHYLSWEGVEGGEWLDSSVFTLELSESTEISTVSARNTHKVYIFEIVKPQPEISFLGQG